MKKKLGRPPTPARKRLTEFFRVRLSPRDYGIVKRAIRDSGEEQSDWLREALLAKATPGGRSGVRRT